MSVKLVLDYLELCGYEIELDFTTEISHRDGNLLTLGANNDRCYKKGIANLVAPVYLEELFKV